MCDTWESKRRRADASELAAWVSDYILFEHDMKDHVCNKPHTLYIVLFQ